MQYTHNEKRAKINSCIHYDSVAIDTGEVWVHAKQLFQSKQRLQERQAKSSRENSILPRWSESNKNKIIFCDNCNYVQSIQNTLIRLSVVEEKKDQATIRSNKKREELESSPLVPIYQMSVRFPAVRLSVRHNKFKLLNRCQCLQYCFTLW